MNDYSILHHLWWLLMAVVLSCVEICVLLKWIYVVRESRISTEQYLYGDEKAVSIQESFAPTH